MGGKAQSHNKLQSIEVRVSPALRNLQAYTRSPKPWFFLLEDTGNRVNFSTNYLANLNLVLKQASFLKVNFNEGHTRRSALYRTFLAAPNFLTEEASIPAPISRHDGFTGLLLSYRQIDFRAQIYSRRTQRCLSLSYVGLRYLELILETMEYGLKT
ncbi:hypothetical protein BDY19DRAFT_649574 [Irpex rosettiformis]|uniref:Uncharacterized protein n=1 Tax=Irpex rosettiformis TaxID=378272 RepID=A0ACB8TNN0_9APHY|nr:hypothetical protein BDY19DRAFT_649574 [Irpex rosettiformis]